MIKITILVELTKDQLFDDELYICGNHEKLGNWNPALIKMDKIDELNYQLNLEFEKGEMIEFKVTRGEWDTVEKNADSSDMKNHTLLIEKDETLKILVSKWADEIKYIEEHSLTGNFKIHKNFSATKLDNERDIIVYLPPKYFEPSHETKSYPVLYMHDGNNIFDAQTAFGGVEWKIDETTENLIEEELIKSVIIVGIYNNINRDKEYTQIKDPENGGGYADLYADFIIKDLKPFIDSTYRTKKERIDTGIMGSSLGGLVSLYIGFKYSQYFHYIGAVSPSIWWANNHITRFIEENENYKNLKLWMDIGFNEGNPEEKEISQAVLDCRELRDILLEKGFISGNNFSYFEDPQGDHSEKSWSKRMHLALKFFFGKKIQTQ